MKPSLVFASIFFVLLFLCGCSLTSHTSGLQDYKPIDPSRIVSPVSEPTSVQNSSVIIVKRDNGIAGSALSARFYVDGNETANFRAGNFMKFGIESGEHIFGVKSSKKGFIIPAQVFRELTIDCKPGKTYTLRLYPDWEEGIQIQRSSY